MYSIKQNLVFLLILNAMYSVDICSAYVLKPFNFQCFEQDICQFPYQFCSSAEHERICLPCLPSVCARTDVPLQCQYNCSLAVDNAGEIGETYSYEWSVVWFYMFICETCVTLVAVLLYCLRTQRRKKVVVKSRSESEEKSLMKTEGGNSEENNNQGEDIANQSYGERKLTHVPTTNSHMDDSYAPTTHLSKIQEETETE